MTAAQKEQVDQFIKQGIAGFHGSRLTKLNFLKLRRLLSTKNPYLYRALDCTDPEQFIKALLDASISSGVETNFGNFLEQLAIFVCEVVYGGQKSSSKGIDLEFELDGKRYVVSIKSGPHWGNSSQQERLVMHFNTAKKLLHQNPHHLEIVCVEGCCYGKDNADKGTHLKRCGQEFWKLVSGDAGFYKEIIVPMAHAATECEAAFQQVYSAKLQLLTAEFVTDFCENGNILWDKIVEFNSGS